MANRRRQLADEVRLGSAVLLVASVSSGGLQTLRIDEAGDGEDGTVRERCGYGAGTARMARHEDGDDGTAREQREDGDDGRGRVGRERRGMGAGAARGRRQGRRKKSMTCGTHAFGE